MNRTTNTRSTLVLVACASVLTQCSSTPTPPPQTNATVTTSHNTRVEPTVDLSAVSAPDTMVMTARSPSPRGMVRHIAERIGMNELVQTFEEQIPSMLQDDEALAHILDLDAPVDVVMDINRDNRTGLVFSIGTLPMPRAEDGLAQGHRLTPMTNGARRIERSDNEGSATLTCALAPAAGGDERTARVVCAEREELLATYIPYLTRTLPRTPMAAASGDLLIEVASDRLRARYSEEARHLADTLPNELTVTPDPNVPTLQGLVQTYVREQLAPTLTHGLEDLGGARFMVRFANGNATLAGDASFRSTEAPMIRRMLATVHDQHLTPEQLNRLPPNGMLYSAWSLSLASLNPERELLGPALAHLFVTPELRLPPADATALRSTFLSMFNITGLDRVSTACTGNARPDGAGWNLCVANTDVAATSFIPQVRNLVAALRRPAIVRYFQREIHINTATLRTPPTTGLPVGSYFVQVPIPATVEASVRATWQLGNMFEVLMVPEGNTLWVGYGVDAIAHYREARAAHPPPAEIPNLTAEGVVAAASFSPAGLSRMISRLDADLGRNIERGLQRANAGNAMFSTYYRVRSDGNGAVLSGEFNIPDAVLQAVGAMLRQN
jgi:hypothetical protein